MRRSGISPADLPPKYQAQVAAQLQPRGASPAHLVPAPAKRLRQATAGLNKTERAFGEWLLASAPADALIHTQAVTFRLANGCRYTPDFVVSVPDQKPVVYEVKGFMREDAAVKIKVAAAAYPWMTFVLVWRKGRASQWEFQKILP